MALIITLKENKSNIEVGREKNANERRLNESLPANAKGRKFINPELVSLPPKKGKKGKKRRIMNTE